MTALAFTTILFFITDANLVVLRYQCEQHLSPEKILTVQTTDDENARYLATKYLTTLANRDCWRPS